MILDAQFTEQEVELNADFGVVKVVSTGATEELPVWQGGSY